MAVGKAKSRQVGHKGAKVEPADIGRINVVQHERRQACQILTPSNAHLHPCSVFGGRTEEGQGYQLLWRNVLFQ